LVGEKETLTKKTLTIKIKIKMESVFQFAKNTVEVAKHPIVSIKAALGNELTEEEEATIRRIQYKGFGSVMQGEPQHVPHGLGGSLVVLFMFIITSVVLAIWCMTLILKLGNSTSNIFVERDPVTATSVDSAAWCLIGAIFLAPLTGPLQPFVMAGFLWAAHAKLQNKIGHNLEDYDVDGDGDGDGPPDRASSGGSYISARSRMGDDRASSGGSYVSARSRMGDDRASSGGSYVSARSSMGDDRASSGGSYVSARSSTGTDRREGALPLMEGDTKYGPNEKTFIFGQDSKNLINTIKKTN